MKSVVCLLLAVCLRAQDVTDLSPDEQDHLLDRMHEYGDHYIHGLPDFLCKQVTHQAEMPAGSDKWKNGDTLIEKLSYHNGEEQRVVELVNGKPPSGRKRGHSQATRLSTEGEFGLLMQSVLGQDSHAVFKWNRWETLRGRRLAVFDFSVDLLHSDLVLTSGDQAQAKAIVAYRGSVYADPESAAVWRIVDVTGDIPPILQTRELSTTVDYNEIEIGHAKYLLPVHATVTLVLWTRRVRHELDFEDYRKFEAESVITFGSESAPENKQ